MGTMSHRIINTSTFHLLLFSSFVDCEVKPRNNSFFLLLADVTTVLFLFPILKPDPNSFLEPDYNSFLKKHHNSFLKIRSQLHFFPWYLPLQCYFRFFTECDATPEEKLNFQKYLNHPTVASLLLCRLSCLLKPLHLLTP